MSGQVEFTPAAADYADANRANLIWAWYRGRTLRRWAILVLLCAGAGAIIGWSDGGYWAIVIGGAYALLGVVLMPAIYLVTYVLVPMRVARLVRQQTSSTLLQHWTWDETGVTITHAQGSSKQPWAELFGWREAKSGFALFLNERSLFPLPRRALTNEQADDFRSVIKEAGVRLY